MTLVPPSSRSGSGGSGADTLIASFGPIGAGVSNFDFTSIPGTYNHLRVIALLKDTSVSGTCNVTFNGDTGGNYDFGRLEQTSTTVAGVNSAASTSIQTPTCGSAVVATNPGIFELLVPGYAQTTFRKVCWTRSGFDLATPVQQDFVAGEWVNTAAITRITLTPGSNWNIGSAAYLYGIT